MTEQSHDTAAALAAALIDEAPAPSPKADEIAATLTKDRAPDAPGGTGPVPTRSKTETRGRHKKGCLCATCAAKAIGAKSSPNTTSNIDPFVPPAVVLVGTLTGMAMTALDAHEWKPEKAETDNMVRAWRDLFQRYNVTDVPAGIAVIVAMAGYVLPRLSRPVTTTKVQRFVAWIKGKKISRQEKE